MMGGTGNDSKSAPAIRQCRTPEATSGCGESLPPMGRFDLAVVHDLLRRSFWFFPVVAMLAGAGLGFLVPLFDSATGGEVGIFTTSDISSARGLLETIATVTVSVAGVAFSVTVVALQLASQQLGPRVLRTFQTDRVSKATLAAFLGLFVYALIALGRLSTLAEEVTSPNAVLTLAVIAAILAFGLFAVFIQSVIVSLEASTLIRRIAADASRAVENRYPKGIGTGVAQVHHAGEGPSAPIRAERAGYVTSIAGDELIALGSECDGLFVQRVQVGQFVVTGTVLAEARGSEARALAERSLSLFEIGQERTLVQDIGFPIRQLADIALRALSPSLNDPTTAENALGSITHVLGLVAREEPVPLVRADEQGVMRLHATAPDFSDLVELGYEQIRLHSESNPVFRRRATFLLTELHMIADENGAPTAAVDVQLKGFEGDQG